MRDTAFAMLIPFSTLNCWNEEFDENMNFYIIPDNRGKCKKITSEIVRRIVEAANGYQSKGRRIRLQGFTRHLKMEHNIDISAKTIGEILTANGLRSPKTRKKRPRFFRSLCQRIPNGVLSIDGSEVTVILGEEIMKLNLEMAVDVASFYHTAFNISDSETTMGFIDVLESHRQTWGNPLGILCDHGSANLSDDSRKHLQLHDIELVPVGPANPKGNGTVESGFSQFKDVIGEIRLNTTSSRTLAKSVLELLVSVYIKMRNKLNLRGESVSPLSKMSIRVPEQEKKQERQRLKKHKCTRQGSGEDRTKLDRLHFLIKNHAIEAEKSEVEHAEKTIRYYETDAIIESEKAFLKAVRRKVDRKNLSYFFGILRNIQQDRDDQAYANYCRKSYNYEQMCRQERSAQEAEERNKPAEYQDVVKMLVAAENTSVRVAKGLALRLAERWMKELVEKSNYKGILRKNLKDAIATLSNIGLEQKSKIWQLAETIIYRITNDGSVTQFS